LEKHGRIDAFVNCAGFVHPRADLEKTRYQDLVECFQTNVLGLFNFLERVVPVMRSQKGGVIVNVASKSARYAVPGLAAYSASKSAGVSLIQALAKEVADANLLCVTVSPSGMNTPMRALVYGEEDAKRQQSPEMVARIVCEIVSGERSVPQGADILIIKEKVIVNEMPDLQQ
jgi:NAD(P)-dependent dehydrogenase (short-subunit alcohol dehydrogenase family)